MNSTAKKIVLFLGATCALLLTWYLFFSSDPTEKKFKELEKRVVTPKPIKEDFDESQFQTGPDGQIVYDNLTVEQMAIILRKKYGAKINNAHVQVSMLEKLIRDLKAKYGDRWVEVLQEVLATAFPNLETKLFRISEYIYKYNKYLEANHKRLNKLSDADRQKELWKMRRDLFGDAAEEIWAGEKKYLNITGTLKQIEEAKNLPVKEKLNMYSKSLSESFGKELPSVMENRRQNLMESFLKVVQDDLSTMSPQERKENLREIRKSMGMDISAIQRWESLDAERDVRWENNEKYKSERQSILSRYSGEEKERKLDEIRKKYYGEEAESVKNEESSGFYRFEQKRQWGID